MDATAEITTAAGAAAARRGRALSNALRSGGLHTVLILGSIVMLFPFFWMLMLSLGTQQQLFRIPPQWLPDTLHWENYLTGLTQFNFLRALGNTLFITALALIGQLVSVTMVAFAFARLRWPGRDFFFVVLLATMMIPPQVTQIPLYILWRSLGAIDTYWPLIVPNFFGDPFLIFFARQFFLTIPVELEEAARVDGCGYWAMFTRIFVPLSIPLLLTISLFTILWNWNDFYSPLIYLTSPEKFTLQLGLLSFNTQFRVLIPPLMAASVLIVAPIIIIFLFGQRYFIKSIVLTGLK
jgi:ABC-type glycerol-3-phosphate transport system permease component